MPMVGQALSIRELTNYAPCEFPSHRSLAFQTQAYKVAADVRNTLEKRAELGFGEHGAAIIGLNFLYWFRRDPNYRRSITSAQKRVMASVDKQVFPKEGIRLETPIPPLELQRLNNRTLRSLNVFKNSGWHPGTASSQQLKLQAAAIEAILANFFEREFGRVPKALIKR